ncbi:hypothetical protein DPMN_058749 [Dreissena polymorpha]|uniref:EGF-like domain-containing protein n=1 Tax=Dreissena polymorpha TaxID=45954 RepID=A0A9D4C2B4_DREPO|nr:hypothetical protein DPMN_058749 [Dreissena polymorpha]
MCAAVAEQAQPECSVNCTHCTASKFESCMDGFYPYFSNCLTCSSQNCKRCDTSGLCTSCKTEFYGASCSNQCGSGCINGACGFDTGACPCLDGFNLWSCRQACSDKCQDVCDKTSAVCRCQPGFCTNSCN